MRMRITLVAFAVLALASANALAKSPEQEDWAAARKATCQELTDAYRSTVAAERKVVAAIKASKDGTVTGNVIGIGALALFGIGFFYWDDNVSAEENLADLRHDIEIITTVASEKKCQLPEIKSP